MRTTTPAVLPPWQRFTPEVGRQRLPDALRRAWLSTQRLIGAVGPTDPEDDPFADTVPMQIPGGDDFDIPLGPS